MSAHYIKRGSIARPEARASTISGLGAILLLLLEVSTARPSSAKAAERAAVLAATISRRVLAVERRLGGARSRGDVLESVVANVRRLYEERDPRGRLRRVWLADATSLPIGEHAVGEEVRRLGGGCAALRRLGMGPAFMAGMTEPLCGAMLHVLAVDSLAAARLPSSRRSLLRYEDSMPTQPGRHAAEGWDLFLEYGRRQGQGRLGRAGPVWAAPTRRKEALAALVREIFRSMGEAVWRRAMQMRPEDPWVSAAAMDDALEHILPARRRGRDVLFHPRSGPSIRCPEWAADAVSRSRGPWEELMRLLEAPTSLDLAPLSPTAAEAIVERVTALASALAESGSPWREGGLVPGRLEPPEGSPLFIEVPSGSSGLDLPPREAPRDDRLSDQMPGGAAVLDYDGDGLPDLFLCDFDQARLYRNLGGMRFADVTAASGLSGASCRNGASSADYDNDGRPDLLLLHGREGRDSLWHNEGGKFREVTGEVGLPTASAQTASAVWFDFDRDGRLDLFLVEYGDLSFASREPDPGDAKNGCPNRLFRNLGGRFVDVSTSAGVADSGWGLAAAAWDADQDGYPDLLVINDFGRAVFYRNRGDGTFAERTEASGLASFGNGMGVSVADYDGDGRPDVFLTYIGDTRPKVRFLFPGAHPRLRTEISDLRPQSNRLFRGRGDGTFEDRSEEIEQIPTGWGWNGLFLDSANSGNQDLFLVNGWWPHRHFYDEDAKAFWMWDPAARLFRDRSEVSGLDFGGNSRVSVYDDFDGDGCVDLLVTGFHAPRLFKGACPKSNHWLELRLEGSRVNRDGIGARATVRAGGKAQTAELGPQGGGFQNSLRRVLRFGLGESPRFESVEVDWPGGGRQVVGPGEADRVLVVRQKEPEAR